MCTEDETQKLRRQAQDLLALIDAACVEAGESVSMQAWGWLHDLSEKAHAVVDGSLPGKGL
jgi:hypothetical protein